MHLHTNILSKKVKVKVKVTQLCVTLCNPWTVACQAPLSMEFSRPKYWSGLPFLSPGDLPDTGIKPKSPACRQILYQLSQPGKPPCFKDL